MTGTGMHSVVALLEDLPEDLPEEGLVRGQVGTVVENWAVHNHSVRLIIIRPPG